MASTALVPQSGVKKIVSAYHAMKARAEKAKGKTEALTGHVISAAVHGGVGAAVGFAEQKLGSRPFANLDAPVLGLVTFGGLAALEAGGKHNEYLFDAAKACAALAAYKVTKRNVELSDVAKTKNADKGVLAGDDLDDLRNEA